MLSRVSICWCVVCVFLDSSLCDYDFDQVNANGNVVRSEILGAVKMKCYLSGMPELRLGLNDKVMFESTGRSESLSNTLLLLPILTPLTSCAWKSYRDGRH